MQTYEQLANDKGLVLMRIIQPFAPWHAGALAGFPPDDAQRLARLGAAVPLDPNGREAQITEATPLRIEADPRSEVRIPDNWKDQHHLQQINLAKKIAGTTGEMDKEQAINIISEELKRRESNGIQEREPGGSARPFVSSDRSGA